MADATLLPCPNPWCEDGIYDIEHREGGFFRVGCTCGVAGPPSTNEDSAVALWNTRQPQLPSDNGLIKALEKARDFLREAPLESGVCCCGDKVEHHSMGSGHSPVDELQYHASNLAEEIDEALSRHKAPLSVAGDDVERLQERLVAFVQQPKWRDDAAEPEDNPDWRSGYEAALSNLREELKPWWPFGGPLCLAALQVTEGDKLRDALEQIVATLDGSSEELEDIDVLNDRALEIAETALRSQSNKVSKPL